MLGDIIVKRKLFSDHLGMIRLMCLRKLYWNLTGQRQQNFMNELRSVRAEKDRLDREKRVTSTHSRQSPYLTLPQTQYYRGHPYTQPYNNIQAASPASNYRTTTAAIPVQIPVGSLPCPQALRNRSSPSIVFTSSRPATTFSSTSRIYLEWYYA